MKSNEELENEINVLRNIIREGRFEINNPPDFISRKTIDFGKLSNSRDNYLTVTPLAFSTWRTPNRVRSTLVLATIEHTAVSAGTASEIIAAVRNTYATTSIAQSRLQTGSVIGDTVTSQNCLSFFVPANFDYRFTRTFNNTFGTVKLLRELTL